MFVFTMLTRRKLLLTLLLVLGGLDSGGVVAERERKRGWKVSMMKCVATFIAEAIPSTHWDRVESTEL